jgi:hypothetical protein
MDLDKASVGMMGCPICAKSGLRFSPCRDWIRCHHYHQLGHVARHCFTVWKRPGVKKSNQANPNLLPNVLEKNISVTLRRIWVAKATTAVGPLEAKGRFWRR